MPFRRAVAALTLLASLAVARPTRAGEEDEPHVPGVSTWIAGRDVHVQAVLAPGLPRDVSRRLLSGLPTTTLWRIRLFVFRNLWFNSLKDERHYEVTATYRPVTGDYTVERRLDDRLLQTRIVPTQGEAAEALREVPGLPSFTLGPHLLGKKLVVKVSCAYATGLALGVVPTTVETDWVRSGIFEWNGSPSP